MTTSHTDRDQKLCDACWGNEECAKCGGTGYLNTALSAGFARKHSNGASEKQVAFAAKLVAEYVELIAARMDADTIDTVSKAMAKGADEAMATKATASKFIDAMITSNRRIKRENAEKRMAEGQAAQAVRKVERKAGERNPADVDGMYLLPDGRIVKVQFAVHGSGQPYAKLLVELDTPEIKRGKEVRYGFEYTPGLVKECKPEYRMSLEQAKEWGALYGACCCCGATLTDEKSIEAGIGPICARKLQF